MSEKTVYDWGQLNNIAPSIKRAHPIGWLLASFFIGLGCALCSLALSWRPWPGLPPPPGALPEHLGFAAKMLAHALSNHLFAADARLYAHALGGWSEGERDALIWRAALAAWSFLMPGVFLAKSYLNGRDGLIHLRGSTRWAGREAVARINGMLEKRVRRRPDHEVAPDVPFPADLWTRHVLFVGGVGSGKSTAIKPLIDKVVAAGEQMLLFDPKSEFTIGFAAPEIIAPWDSRSLSWDIAADMRNPLDMRRFAAAMIKESQDPMWSNASRQLLVGLMIYLKTTRGRDWGWHELRSLIALPQAQLYSIMADWHPEAMRAVEKASVTTAGILINLSSFCSSIFDLAEAWGDVPKDRRVSFVEWTAGKSPFKQIILQGHGAYVELTKSYVEGIVGIFSAMVNSVEMRDDSNRKIWFIADEFAMMGKIPVRPLFEVGRSRGVRCVVACQDFAQLEEIYGAHMVKALVGMCGTLLVGQIMQGETAEQLCKAFGSREVERANTSSSFGAAGSGAGKSTTLSFNRDEVALYKPSELTSRLGLSPDGAGVTLLLFTGGHAFELYWPLYNVREEREGHVPAPWTLGSTMLALAQAPEIAAKPQASASNSASGYVAATDEELGGTNGSGLAVVEDGPTIQKGDGSGAAALAVSSTQATSVIEDSPAPREAIEVIAIPLGIVERAESGVEPMFDAVAELAMLKAGLEPIALAAELISAIEASASPVGAPRQRVGVVPAAKTSSAMAIDGRRSH